MTPRKVKNAINMILFNEQYRKKIIADYHRLIKHMGEGNCAQRAARQMVAMLKED
jgi:lipid-A-disaccharide synthase